MRRDLTLSHLGPDWDEDFADTRQKASIRPLGTMRMSLLRLGKTPEYSRRYEPGDQVTYIDWKAFARTDSLIVRQQRDEANAKVAIVVDIGNSMTWPTTEERKSLPDSQKSIISKSNLALRVAYWLAHTHLRSGDTVEFWLRTKTQVPHLCWKPKQSIELLNSFEFIKRSEGVSLDQYFSETSWNPLAFDQTVLITDFIESLSLEAIYFGAKRVRLIHLLSSLETDPKWLDDETCYLYQSDTKKDYLGKQLKSGEFFESEFSSWQMNVEKVVRKHNGDYFFGTDQTPIEQFFHFVRYGEVEP